MTRQAIQLRYACYASLSYIAYLVLQLLTSHQVADGDSSTQNSSFCNATTSEQQLEVGTDKPMSTLPRIEAAGHLLDMMDLVFEPDYSSPKVDLVSTIKASCRVSSRN